MLIVTETIWQHSEPHSAEVVTTLSHVNYHRFTYPRFKGGRGVWTIQILILNFVANSQSYDPYLHEQNVEVYDEFSKFKIGKPENI